MTPFARLALPLFALAALGAGCAGYRLGSPVPEELRAILACGAIPVTLGPLILRVETAAIYGLANLGCARDNHP